MIIMEYVDELRRLYGLKIEEFTQGIKTSRTYSRYLNGQNELPYNILIQYLKRINMEIHDFLFYVDNDMKETNHDYFEFLERVKNKEISEAYEVYNRLSSDSLFGKKNEYLCFYEQKLRYLSKKISKNDMLDLIRKQFNVKRIKSQTLLTREEIEALLFYLLLTTTNEQDKLIQFLDQVLTSKKIQIVALNYEKIQLQIAEAILEVLSHRSPMNKSEEELFRKELDFLCRFVSFGLKSYAYPIYFSYLIPYLKEINDSKRLEWATYFEATFKLSIGMEDSLTKEHKQIYLKHINEAVYEDSILHNLRFES